MKPELIKLDIGKLGKKVKGVMTRERVKEDHGEKESKPAEPTRIKIFEGGYVLICVITVYMCGSNPNFLGFILLRVLKSD